jgi:hypothetical protein
LDWWSEEHERIRETERKISRQKKVDKRRQLAEAKEQARQDHWKRVGMEPLGSQLVPRVDPGQSIRTRETVAKEKKPYEKRDKTVDWRPKGYIPEPTQFDIAVARTYGVALPGVNPKEKFAAWKTAKPSQCASVGQASPHNQQMDQGEIELTVADSRLATERADAATSPCVEPKSPKSPELAVTKVVAMVKPTIRKQTAKEPSRPTTSRDGASMARPRIQAAQRRAMARENPASIRPAISSVRPIIETIRPTIVSRQPVVVLTRTQAASTSPQVAPARPQRASRLDPGLDMELEELIDYTLALHAEEVFKFIYTLFNLLFILYLSFILQRWI